MLVRVRVKKMTPRAWRVACRLARAVACGRSTHWRARDCANCTQHDALHASAGALQGSARGVRARRRASGRPVARAGAARTSNAHWDHEGVGDAAAAAIRRFPGGTGKGRGGAELSGSGRGRAEPAGAARWRRLASHRRAETAAPRLSGRAGGALPGRARSARRGRLLLCEARPRRPAAAQCAPVLKPDGREGTDGHPGGHELAGKGVAGGGHPHRLWRAAVFVCVCVCVLYVCVCECERTCALARLHKHPCTRVEQACAHTKAHATALTCARRRSRPPAPHHADHGVGQDCAAEGLAQRQGGLGNGHVLDMRQGGGVLPVDQGGVCVRPRRGAGLTAPIAPAAPMCASNLQRYTRGAQACSQLTMGA